MPVILKFYFFFVKLITVENYVNRNKNDTFLIFEALMLSTFCKNRGWGLEHNLFGVKLKKTFVKQILCFYQKFSLTKKICKKKNTYKG